VGHWAWALAAAGIAYRLTLHEADPRRNNVYLKVFAVAGQAFAEGRDLYFEANGALTGFRYPPVAAAMFLPFWACGPVLGSLLWRALGFAMLFVALKRSFSSGFPVAQTSRARGFVLIVTVLIGIGSLNNGQSNPHILAMFLLATLGTLAGRDAAPAAAIASCAALKVYPLAYAGVVGVLRPRQLLWLAGFVAGLALLPFLLQDPAYVGRQYAQLFQVLRTEDRTTEGLTTAYRDLRMLTASFGVTTPPLLFHFLQLTGFAAIVGVCRYLHREGAPRPVVGEHAFSLSMCWFLLLGPATEKSTYILLGPSLAWACLAIPGQPRLLRLSVGLALVLALAALLPVDLPRDASPIWRWSLLPYAAALLAVVLAARAVRDCRRIGSRSGDHGRAAGN